MTLQYSSQATMPAADVKTTVRLLRGIERLPEGATGALVFTRGDERLGTLLVEDKRVCWAAASGMETRLTDILSRQANPPIPQPLIEDVFEQCRHDGSPLGAALVSRGLVSAEGLESALRQHTGEATLHLSHLLRGHDRLAPTWLPSRTRRYEAQFTFTPAEILVCVGALGNQEITPRAHRVLAPILEDGVVAAAFFAGRGEASHLPVAQVRGELLGVESLVNLGAWAHGALGDVARFSEGDHLVAATTFGRETVVAWTRDEILYAALCEDRIGLSVLVARRARGASPPSGGNP
jgi:hypothetical protein